MEKKLVSYCLICYNQEQYIREAVTAALEQTYSPLEIIISDDCSTDSTFEIARRIAESYKGPHRIILNRNEKNLGIGGHVSKVLYSIASGDYLITLGGDDVSWKNHVENAVSYLEKYNDVPMIDFCADVIGPEGRMIGEISMPFAARKYTLRDYLLLRRIRPFAPGRIFRKTLVSLFDPIPAECPTEDTVIVGRSLLLGGFYRVNATLVHYRKHGSNITNADAYAGISQLRIMEQLRRDGTRFCEYGFITRRTYRLLMERIDFEYRMRKVKFYSGIPVHYFFKRVFIKILKYIHLIRISI